MFQRAADGNLKIETETTELKNIKLQGNMKHLRVKTCNL